MSTVSECKTCRRRTADTRQPLAEPREGCVATETAVVTHFLVMPVAAKAMALELRAKWGVGGGNKTVHFKAMLCVDLDRRSERGVTVRRPPRLMR